MKYIIAITLLIIISGCNTIAKVSGKLDKLNVKHSGAVATWVGINYPCKIRSADTTIIRDTTIIECEGVETDLPFSLEGEESKTPSGGSAANISAANSSGQKKVIKLKPGQSVAVNSANTTVTNSIKSTADSAICADQIRILNLRIVDKENDFNKQKNKTKLWQGLAIGEAIIVLILGLIIGLILKKKATKV